MATPPPPALPPMPPDPETVVALCTRYGDDARLPELSAKVIEDSTPAEAADLRQQIGTIDPDDSSISDVLNDTTLSEKARLSVGMQLGYNEGVVSDQPGMADAENQKDAPQPAASAAPVAAMEAKPTGPLYNPKFVGSWYQEAIEVWRPPNAILAYTSSHAVHGASVPQARLQPARAALPRIIASRPGSLPAQSAKPSNALRARRTSSRRSSRSKSIHGPCGSSHCRRSST